MGEFAERTTEIKYNKENKNIPNEEYAGHGCLTQYKIKPVSIPEGVRSEILKRLQ